MLHLSLRQLEYFAAAAEHGGAASAAQALGVSQPSISRAVAELEAHWGEALFVRLHARGLQLTSAGALRHRQARALLQQAALLAGPRGARLEGLLRVGCLGTLGPRHLPAILARLRASCPQIEVELHEADSASLLRQLERGQLDAAFTYDMGLPGSLRIDAVAQLAPYAVLPWGHRLAARSSVALTELAREPLVLIDLPMSRDYFLSLFREAGCSPRVAYAVRSLEMVRSMVANGLGVSVLTTRPKKDISADGCRIACRRLRGRVRPQPVVMVSPAAESPQAALVSALVEAARANMQAMQREARADLGAVQGASPKSKTA